jgi:hypothetical protein
MSRWRPKAAVVAELLTRAGAEMGLEPATYGAADISGPSLEYAAGRLLLGDSPASTLAGRVEAVVSRSLGVGGASR